MSAPETRPPASRPLALVTGASGGIGEALAHQFAQGGYDIVLVARSEGRLNDVAQALRARRVEAHVLPADLEDKGAGAHIEAELKTRGLVPDVLVNNAGFGFVGAFLEESIDAGLGQIDVNVRALTELTWRLAGPMRAKGGRGVLNVASTAAFQPGPHMAVYYATKAYVLSFTEALNQEWKGSGLHATALCPGPVATGFQDRAAFDDTMQLMKMMKPRSADAVAAAGYRAFQAKRPVIIPGLQESVMARSAAFAPRGMLLSMVEQLQKKRGDAHG